MITEINDKETYNRLLSNYKNVFITHSWDYLLAECVALNDPTAHPVGYFTETNEGLLLLPLIKRKISESLGDDYWDLTSPYSYSAILGARDPCIHNKFIKSLKPFLLQRRVITLFLRVSPYIWEPHDFESMSEATFVGQTVYISVKNKSHAQYHSNLPYRTRREIRRESDRGVEFKFERLNGATVKKFYEDYSESMRLRGITGYYNLPLEYFNCLLAIHDNEIWYCSAERSDCGARSSALFVSDSKKSTLEYFLAARVGIRHSLTHCLIDYVVKCAIEHEFTHIHLGGGSENLLFFKGSFSKQRINYYVQKIVINHNQLQRFPVLSDIFPTYRELKK